MNKDFTWGDIILSTCRKMFLNKDAITMADLPDLIDDRNYSTYINMAPDVMNELITILNNRVLINIDRVFIDIKDNLLLDKYIFKTPSDYVFHITEYLHDLANPSEEDNNSINYLYTEVIQYSHKRADNLLFEEQDGILYIDRRFLNERESKLQIKYRIIPYKYLTTTPWNTIIDLPYNICAIIPLYLASELYKDDDVSLAVAYRNQFETELDVISSQQVNSLGTEHSRNVGGY